MYKKILFPTILVALIAVGCSKRPKNILSEKKMVDIMADIQIGEAYENSGISNEYINSHNRELIGRGILMKHGVTTAEMDSTMAWYGKNMDEYANLYKKIDEELDKRQKKYSKEAGESEREVSSADLWPYSRRFMLDGKSLTDGIIVNIPAGDITPGDKLTWKMNVNGASSRNLTLGVDYENGSSNVYHFSNRDYNNSIEISLQTDTLLKAERIFAIADFGNPTNKIFIDSIQLTHTPMSREEIMMNGFQRTIRPAGRKIVLPPDTSENSSGVPEAIISKPSESIANNRGVRTLL